MRTDKRFKIFATAEQQLGQKIEMTRVNAQQTNCDNHLAHNAEEYYRRSMYFSCWNDCLEQLRERFTAQTAIAYALSSLLPSFVLDADT